MPGYDIPVLLPLEIRHLRRALGWSQVRLGDFLGRDAATISRWELGHYAPDPLAAGVLYRLWMHVFEGVEYRDEEPRQPVRPHPTKSYDALEALGGLLLTAGVMYVIAKGLEGLEGDDE